MQVDEQVTENSAVVFDAMALVQKVKSLSAKLLQGLCVRKKLIFRLFVQLFDIVWFDKVKTTISLWFFQIGACGCFNSKVRIELYNLKCTPESIYEIAIIPSKNAIFC